VAFKPQLPKLHLVPKQGLSTFLVYRNPIFSHQLISKDILYKAIIMT